MSMFDIGCGTYSCSCRVKVLYFTHVRRSIIRLYVPRRRVKRNSVAGSWLREIYSSTL